MAAPSLNPDGQDRVPMTPGGLALARQRAERGLRSVVLDERGDPAFVVMPLVDAERLDRYDARRAEAFERIRAISELFPEPDAGEIGMQAALEYREEARAKERGQRA